MNDRFKFRVWNPDGKYYDDDPQYNVCVQIDPISGLVLAPFHNNIIEMCTGLKDKNGNLIYEGDRIFDGDYFWQVKWDNYNAQWILSDPEGYETLTEPDAKYLEIIGNIHEQKD